MKILKRFISAVLLFAIAFTVCFLETNIANQDFAFGEDSLTTTASVAGEVTAVKNAAWSQTEADGVRIEIEEARTKGWDNPPTILFLGSLCNVHGLTINTIIKSLTSSAAFGNVHYELFRTDRSLKNRATYSGDISMNATEAEITEKVKDVFMEYSCHSTLYNFANVLKNVTMGYEEGKNHYDYIIMEFDGLRMGHFIDGATTSDANLQAINAAADVMKEFYAAGKVTWIIPKKKTSSETVYPYDYTNQTYQFTTSEKKADSYMFNDRFMDNDDDDTDWGSTDALKARDRVNVRNCIKLLAPEDLNADKTVPNVPYLNNDGKISDTFATLRSRITAEEGKGFGYIMMNL